MRSFSTIARSILTACRQRHVDRLSRRRDFRGLVMLLGSPSAHLAERALMTAGTAAASGLVDVMGGDAPLCRHAADALVRMGSVALPMLAEALASPSSDLCTRSADAIRRIGPAAIPHLISALADPKQHVRDVVARNLLRLNDPRVAPALMDNIDALDRETRRDVVLTLTRLQVACELPRLAKEVAASWKQPDFAAAFMPSAEPDPAIRVLAVGILEAVGGRDAMTCMLQFLSDPDPRVTASVKDSLSRADPATAVDALLGILSSARATEQAQVAAVMLLGELRARSAVGQLCRVQSTEGLVGDAAGKAIGTILRHKQIAACAMDLYALMVRFCESADEAVSAIFGWCDDDEVIIFLCALQKRTFLPGDLSALAHDLLAIGAKRGALAIIDAFNTRIADAATQSRIDKALAAPHFEPKSPTRLGIHVARSIGSARRKAVREWAEGAVSSTRQEIRRLAAFTLGHMGDEAATEPILRLLRDKQPCVRLQAVRALGELGGDASFVGLEAAIGDHEGGVRQQAFRALLAAGSPKSVQLARRLIYDADSEIRTLAIRVAGQRHDSASVNGLIAQLADPQCRLMALDALLWIGEGARAAPSVNALVREVEPELDQLLQEASRLHQKLAHLEREQQLAATAAAAPQHGIVSFSIYADSDREYQFWKDLEEPAERRREEEARLHPKISPKDIWDVQDQIARLAPRIRELQSLLNAAKRALCFWN